jgi:hypothetical protein
VFFLSWTNTRIWKSHISKNRNWSVSKVRYIETNTSKSADREILPEGVGDFHVLHFLPVFDFISHFSIVFLTLLCSCVLFDSYVLLADYHVNNVSYFPFMSIKTYVFALREGYYVIIWLIVRICVFRKDWNLTYSELFILKRKSMENGGRGTVYINCTACVCR